MKAPRKCFDIQMGVDMLDERRGTRVSDNLSDHNLVYMGFYQHGDADVSDKVQCLTISKLLHQVARSICRSSSCDQSVFGLARRGDNHTENLCTMLYRRGALCWQ